MNAAQHQLLERAAKLRAAAAHLATQSSMVQLAKAPDVILEACHLIGDMSIHIVHHTHGIDEFFEDVGEIAPHGADEGMQKILQRLRDRQQETANDNVVSLPEKEEGR